MTPTQQTAKTDDIKLITSIGTLPSSIKFTVALNGGTDANDLIYGAHYDDVLQGFGGDDTIYGIGGANILHGGTGSDVIYGGTGADIIFGGYDDAVQTDRLYGGAGMTSSSTPTAIMILKAGQAMTPFSPEAANG